MQEESAQRESDGGRRGRSEQDGQEAGIGFGGGGNRRRNCSCGSDPVLGSAASEAESEYSSVGGTRDDDGGVGVGDGRDKRGERGRGGRDRAGGVEHRVLHLEAQFRPRPAVPVPVVVVVASASVVLIGGDGCAAVVVQLGFTHSGTLHTQYRLCLCVEWCSVVSWSRSECDCSSITSTASLLHRSISSLAVNNISTAAAASSKQHRLLFGSRCRLLDFEVGLKRERAAAAEDAIESRQMRAAGV